MLRSIVVDDEKPSRDALSNYLKDYCPEVEVISECESAKTACRAIEKHNPDLVFLDIEMPNGNGFDLLHMFNPVPFKVIFVTAFSDYAIKAFRFSATDYLLKPVKVDELVESVKKVQQELALGNSNVNIQSLLKNLTVNNSHFDSLIISDMKGFQVLKIHEIIYCEADGYCTHFHMAGNVITTSTKNLKYYENLLEGHHFLRVHHSSLINLAHVKSYTHQGEILLTDCKTCGLGNNYKKRFLEVFGKLK